MRRKMRIRLDLIGTLFNSLAITVAKREKGRLYALLVCSEGTNIVIVALFSDFMRL
jgi:hypothetical protein